MKVNQNRHSNRSAIVICIISILYVYRTWFTGTVSYGGDFYFPVHLESLPNWRDSLAAWNPLWGAGLGASTFAQLGFYTYSVGLASLLLSGGIPAFIVQILLYILPVLFLGSYGIYRLLHSVTGLGTFLRPTAAFIYLTNSYIFLIISGGQLGIALAYSVVPLLLSSLIRFIDRYPYPTVRSCLTESLIISLLLALLILFDLRYTYIYGMLFAGYLCFLWFIRKLQISSIPILLFWTLIVPLGISAGVHAFWLLPILVNGVNPIAQASGAFTGVSAPHFFSFADLVHAVSLLHPNWPENIFGKTYFMQPEFLLLPVLAYASLLFLGMEKTDRQSDRREFTIIPFFILVGIMGAFLSKGTQEPFGFIYQWMFAHIPGFVLFRDPTKFYVLTAISYAVLIPVTLNRLIGSGRLIHSILGMTLIGVLVWGILHRNYVFSDTGRLLSPKSVPQDFVKLHERISSEDTFFRTLWVPSVHRFGEMTLEHPAVPAFDHMETRDFPEVFRYLNNPAAKTRLQRLGVKYIIIPSDPNGELFLRDRKYDGKLRMSTINAIGHLPWAVRLPSAGDTAIFRVDGSKGKFFYDRPNVYTEIPVRIESATEYRIAITEKNYRGPVVFSEGYDSGWVMDIGERHLSPRETYDHLMAFDIRSAPTMAKIRYRPQDMVEIGKGISIIMFAMVAGILLLLETRKLR